jgi:hypothetical protein
VNEGDLICALCVNVWCCLLTKGLKVDAVARLLFEQSLPFPVSFVIALLKGQVRFRRQ